MSTAALLSPAVSSAVETWTIDPDHTVVEFSVRHLMISTVKGRFRGVRGTVTVDPADPRTAVVDVEIDAASIDTGIAQRDAHLRSPDFFDVGSYPTLTYRSRQVDRAGESELRILGELTIHGVTREVVLHVEDLGRADDPWGSSRAGFTARARIDRRDFGLTYNTVLETGGVMVGEEVKIALEVELIRTASAPAA